MFEATRLASYLSRIRGPDHREWLTAGEAFTLATAGSARVLGFGGELGATAPKVFADLVFLDLGHINYISSCARCSAGSERGWGNCAASPRDCCSRRTPKPHPARARG